MHFNIKFRYKKTKIKNHENYKYKKFLNENFLIYGIACTSKNSINLFTYTALQTQNYCIALQIRTPH